MTNADDISDLTAMTPEVDADTRPEPIVIVHRSSGRRLDFLLLLALIAAVGYIIRLETRPPRVEPRLSRANRPEFVKDLTPETSFHPGPFGRPADTQAERKEPNTAPDGTVKTDRPDDVARDDRDRSADSDLESNREPAVEPSEPSASLSPRDPFDPADPAPDEGSETEDAVEPADAPSFEPVEPVEPEPRRSNAAIVWRGAPADRRADLEEEPNRDGAAGVGHRGRARPVFEPEEPSERQRRLREEIRAEAMRVANEERLVYLMALSELVLRYRLEAAAPIQRLSRQFKRQTVTQIEEDYAKLRPWLDARRVGIEDRIRLLRRLGMPEPRILDEIEPLYHRAIGVRRGPRDAREARVFAARKLLSVPLEPKAIERALASEFARARE